jgi:twinkle protein
MGYWKGEKNMAATKSTGSRYEPQEAMVDVANYPVLAIPERFISKAAAEHFGIKTALSPKDGKTPIAHYFPYHYDGELVGYKKRDLTVPKMVTGHFSVVGFQSPKCDLFGMHCANKTGGKKVVITEGEYDAAATWTVMKEKYPQANPNVVSIAAGTANAVQNLGQKQNQSWLSKFSERITAFDADKATQEEREKQKIMKGKDATAAVYSLMPDILVADLPDDYDPVDMIRDGMADQLYWCVMKPKNYTPDGFVKFESFASKASELPQLGKPWPWPSMTKLSLGRRLGEGHYIGAGVKIGKSEFVNQLSEYVIKVEKSKIALFKFEEEPEITCKKIAGKMYGKDFTNPEKVIFVGDDGVLRDIYGNDIYDTSRGYFDQETLTKAVNEVGDSVIYYNNYGACSWSVVKGAIRHAVLVEGVTDIVLDPISRMVQGLTAAEANTELERFADELSKMAKDLGFIYYCFCHLKAPESGPAHERGGKVLSHQFTGSRAMMRSTYYMWGIERNKDPDISPKERNTSTIVLLEDRKYGRSGYFKVYYDQETGNYLEPPEGFLESSVERLADYAAISNTGHSF